MRISLSGLLSLCAVCVTGTAAVAETERERIRLADGHSVTYFVAHPDILEEGRTYPVIIAFGGGAQRERQARGYTDNRLKNAAEEGGYFVVAPAASGGRLYFKGGEEIFPAFFDHLTDKYPIEDKFHMLGLSNGGISAFHIAALHAERVKTITSFPGYLWQANDERYEALKDVCIVMYAGERDTNWVRLQNRDVAAFGERGKEVYAHVFPGEGHVPASLSADGGARLIQGIEDGWGC